MPINMMEFLWAIVLNNLKLFVSIVISLLLVAISYNWKRRYLYYYGAKLPGPLALPLLGSIHLIREGPQSIYKVLSRLFQTYPTVFKMWLGPDLYVCTTEPHHLKTILTKFLDKGDFYQLMSEYFQRALAAAPVSLWKQHRKNINPTFNVTLIGSFIDVFAKHADNLVQNLEKDCGKQSDDIFPSMWKCTLDAACESLSDVDSKLIRTQDYLPAVFRIEEILLRRFFHPILHLNIFWKFSSERKELIKLWRQNCSFIQKIIDLKPPEEEKILEEDALTKRRFLNHLVNLENNNKVPQNYILEEAQIMYFVGTETSAVALSSTMVVLGMYPDVQKKINEELNEIFGDSARAPTLEDINRMNYLERVIKEVLRFLPPIPFVMRTVEENIQLDSHVFPAGSKMIIPITFVHRKPEFWPEPLKFDPDRFLPEEVEKRPPCAYIPFSYGIRNCIGNKYGLLSMKVIMSKILRTFTITSSNYKSIEDMDLIVHVVAKPKDGFKVTLEKKQKSNKLY